MPWGGSSSSSSWFLPVEIVEMIIDSLAEDNDTDSLKSTSLVCQSVLPRCRKHLFFSIKIRENQFSKEHLALLFPHTRYIRRLEYRVLESNDIPSTSTTPALLERISFLRCLSIIGHNRWLNNRNWIYPCLHPSLRSALLNLMHLPTLTHLHLTNFENFLVSDLFPCTNLKHLQLDQVEILDESPRTPSRSDVLNTPKIQEYTFRQSSRTTMRLLTAKLDDGRLALDFTNLKTLSVEREKIGDIEVTGSLLRESKQLEELRIELYDLHNDGGLTGLADMAFHTSGTTLCLVLVVNFKTLIFSLCNELSTMATAKNILKTLRIEIAFCRVVEPGELEELDTVLSSPGWSCLEHISLDIISWNCREAEKELQLMTDLPDMRFIRLSSRTSLDFKLSVQFK